MLLPATNRRNNRLQPALFSNARITGTVTVDATNRMEINAVPVARESPGGFSTGQMIRGPPPILTRRQNLRISGD
jgi:hypothetical protein